MTEISVEVSFPDAPPNTANSLVESLAKDLRREVYGRGQRFDPVVRRKDKTAQDFGTTLIVVLGTPAVIVLANAIRDWAKRTDRASITMNGVYIENVCSSDVSDILSAIEKGNKSAEDHA